MVDQDRERQLIRDRVLGWAPACDPLDQLGGIGDGPLRTLTGQADLGRDLRLTVGPNGRDLARVRGLDNLAQSLAIALTTLLGNDLFNTEFGFDGLNALVEETSPILARERVRVAVIRVLRRDPRVRQIVDVKFEDGRLDPAGGAPADAAAGAASPSFSRALGVRVAFETITADQAALTVGNVAPGGPGAPTP
jgi:phage baseplate assembly protein W